MILSDYLQKNYRSMEDGEGYFTRGLGYPSPESFDRADIRILYIFLSSTDVRFMSGTYQTLYGLIDRDLGSRVFQDSYYFDFYYKGNVEKMVNDGVCPLFGNVSHRPFQDYDIIAVSLSVFGEVLNIPWLFKQAGIPLSFEERMNRKDIPLIVLGGAAASSAHILFGDVGNGKQSLVDCVFFGHVEEIWSEFVESYIGHSDKATFVRKFASSDSRLFVPADYVYDHEVTGGKLSIRGIRKLNPDLPDKISISQITKPESILTFHKKLFGAGITGAHSTDLVISSGCTGSGACSFCLEGNLIKPWVEAPLENIVEGMERIRRSGASKLVGFNSFNTTYHSYLPEILGEAVQRFKRVAVLKQRADMVACSPGYLEFCKATGMRKIQLSVEGMGDRIRNRLYNKNLSREVLMDSVRETFRHAWIELKLALIVSGIETQADVDEWMDELEEVVSIRKALKSRSSIKITHTPLIIYPETPLRWFPRVNSHDSYYGVKRLSEYVTGLVGRFYVKYHSRQLNTFIQQTLIDLGRYGTPMLVSLSLQGVLFRKLFLRRMYKHIFDEGLSAIGIDVDTLFESPSVGAIFPVDIFDMFSEAKLNKWREQNEKVDFRESVCLATPANEGKCLNCNACPDIQHKKWTTTREVNNNWDTLKMDELLSGNTPKETIRFVCYVSPGYEMLCKESLSQYITSLFVNSSEKLYDGFYSVGFNSDNLLSRQYHKLYTGGYFAFDVEMRTTGLLDDFISLKNCVNRNLDGCEIREIFYPLPDSSFRRRNLIKGYVGVADRKLVENISSALKKPFNNTITHPKSGPSFLPILRRREVPELEGNIQTYFPDALPKKGTVLLTIPPEINPYYVFGSIQRRSGKWAYANIIFNVFDMTAGSGYNCSCGSPIGFSCFHNGEMHGCIRCRGKRLVEEKYNICCEII